MCYEIYVLIYMCILNQTRLILKSGLLLFHIIQQTTKQGFSSRPLVRWLILLCQTNGQAYFQGKFKPCVCKCNF